MYAYLTTAGCTNECFLDIQWVEFEIDYDSECYQEKKLTVCVFLLKDLTL